MRHLTGVYKTTRNKRKKFDITIAGSWDELAPGQFGTAIYLLQVTRNADPEWIRLSLLALLFERHFPILEGLQEDERYEIKKELTGFFYSDEPPLKNFFPVLKTANGDLIPCALDLSNIGFGEWCFLDTYFGFYYRSGAQDEWLDKMIATVYRPRDLNVNESSPDYSGDHRQIFNENLIDARAELIKGLRKDHKMAIFQWLAIALQKVKEERPDVFPPSPEDIDDHSPIDQNEHPDNAGWMDVFSDLIGPKFGTSAQLKHTNAMFVLDYLNREQRSWKELKANNP